MSQILKPKKGYKKVKGLFRKYEEIPEEWEYQKLGNVCDEIYRYPTYFNIVYVEKGIPEIRGELILKSGKLEPDISKYRLISKHTASKFPRTTLQENDFVFSVRGTMGKVAIISKQFENSNITANLMRISPDRKLIFPKFLFYIFFSKSFQDRLQSLSPQTTIKTIQSDALKSIRFFISPFPEQQKIASILSNIDNLINSTQKIIDQIISLKQGLMQKLLTKGIGHKKFKKVKWLFGKEIEIPEEWISKKVEDVFKLKSGSTPSRTKPEFFEGDISWVTSTDLNRSKITSTIEKITKNAVKDARLTILTKGTFLIATYGLEADKTRGKCGIIEMNATCNQACMAFLPSSEMDSLFLFYFYLCFGEKIIFSIAQGTKQQNLYSDTVKKVTLLIPPLKEQQKIISVLSNIDSCIQSQTKYKEKLEKLKKSLMQKLLTGEVKVKI